MYTNDIESILQPILSENSYLGTYSSDNCPKLSPNQAVIFNNKPRGFLGEHWLCYYKDDHGTLNYFDSYGIPIEVAAKNGLIFHDVIEYLATEKAVKYSNVRLQSLLTQTCGQFCIYFLLQTLGKGLTVREIIAFLSSLPNPDDFVARHIERLSSYIQADRELQNQGQTCCKFRDNLKHHNVA
jgi:hypothetical protein